MRNYQKNELTKELIIEKVSNVICNITGNSSLPQTVKEQLESNSQNDLFNKFCFQSNVVKNGPCYFHNENIYDYAVSSGAINLDNIANLSDLKFKKHVAINTENPDIMRELYSQGNPDINALLNIRGFGLDEIIKSGDIEKIGLIYTHSINFKSASNTVLKNYQHFQEYFEEHPEMCVLPKNRYMKFDSNKDKTLQIDRTKVNSKIADKTTSKQVDKKL